MAAHPERRHHRLPPDAYLEEDRVFSVTLGTSPRQPVFEDLTFGLACVELLRELHEAHRVPVYAYCLMPDHVHLLIGTTPALPLPRFLQLWKSLCYRARRRQGKAEKFWQRSYFDHGLRHAEDLRQAARYILDNPLRAGLVEDFRRYPLCGSFEWKLG